MGVVKSPKWIRSSDRDGRVGTCSQNRGSEREEREALKMAESGEDVVFSSLQEEMEYWKEKALELRTRYGNYRAGSVVG